MRNWWMLIRNEQGYQMQITVMASDAFQAYQQAVAMYGRERMISEHANICA